MTIFLDGATGAIAEPRANILRLPPGAYEMPVIRLERDPQSSKTPARSAAQRGGSRPNDLDLARITHARALQIDFDAPESARPFRELHVRYPESVWTGKTKSWFRDQSIREHIEPRLTSP